MKVVDKLTAGMVVVVLKRQTMMQLWCSHAGGTEYGEGGILVPMILRQHYHSITGEGENNNCAMGHTLLMLRETMMIQKEMCVTIEL